MEHIKTENIRGTSSSEEKANIRVITPIKYYFSLSIRDFVSTQNLKEVEILVWLRVYFYSCFKMVLSEKAGDCWKTSGNCIARANKQGHHKQKDSSAIFNQYLPALSLAHRLRGALYCIVWNV